MGEEGGGGLTTYILTEIISKVSLDNPPYNGLSDAQVWK